jgi:CRISPR-associated endonuclease/helicase Cas3
LHVLAPLAEKDADKDWFNNLFPRAAKIYPHHGRLWKTARWLQQQNEFSIPENAREMLEYVYSDSTDVPQDLWKSSARAEQESKENANQAFLNVLKFSLGYEFSAAAWDAKEKTPTRLGEPCQVWRLFKKNGSSWDSSGEGSEINLPVRILYEESTDAQEQGIIQKLKKPGYMKYKKVLLLSSTTPGHWTGRARKIVDYVVGTVTVFYDSEQGFHFR